MKFDLRGTVLEVSAESCDNWSGSTVAHAVENLPPHGRVLRCGMVKVGKRLQPLAVRLDPRPELAGIVADWLRAVETRKSFAADEATERRAAFQRRPVAEVLHDVEAAREALRAAPWLTLAPGTGTCRDCADDWPGTSQRCGCDVGSAHVRDLRGREIPELPEAAARDGVAFLATPRPGPDGRRKVVLQCAGPDHLAAWPAWAAAQGLVDLYGGDAARGFAGGYMT
jgi:hypothetical protein